MEIKSVIKWCTYAIIVIALFALATKCEDARQERFRHNVYDAYPGCIIQGSGTYYQVVDKNNVVWNVKPGTRGMHSLVISKHYDPKQFTK